MISVELLGHFISNFYGRIICEASGIWDIAGNPKPASLIVRDAYIKSFMAKYNLLYPIILLPLSLDFRFLKDPVRVPEIL